MRRSFIVLLAAFMLAALLPSAALAAKPTPPTSNVVTYLGEYGDLVYYSDTIGVWNTRDGYKDDVFQLDLAPTTARDLVAVRMSAGDGVWDTIAGNGVWGIGVTPRTHGKLINNPDSSIATMDLDGGLRIFLHMTGATYVYSGVTVNVYACYDATCTDYLPLSVVV